MSDPIRLWFTDDGEFARWVDVEPPASSRSEEYFARPVAEDAALLARIATLEKALRAMLEPQDEACWYDHHGLCQAHHLRTNENGEPECEVALARAALGKDGR